MEKNEIKRAVRFIDKIYRELYQSDIVLRRNKQINNKFENIQTFIEKLEEINKRPFLKEFVKRILYNTYLIKIDDISDDFIIQKFGFIKNINTPSVLSSIRLQYYNKVILDQKYSLDMWLNFFFSKEMDNIHMWAKYWAFQGMIRLGTYNNLTGKFNKRQKNNTCVFADLNKEALLLSIKYITRIVNMQSIYDKELKKILNTGSFKHIYEYFLLKSRTYFIETDVGKWIKYPQGSNPSNVVLSLQGYNTNWCITGYGSAAKQLSTGDLHIYYSRNNEGEYKVPRLAIYMEQGSIIREICGIAPGQNIEEGFENIVEEKIKEFPTDFLISNRLMQVDYLSFLHRKSQQEDFSKQELMFLYEINNNISGLVPKRDPRIKEIISKRDIRHDLAIIFDCKEDEIAIGQDELFDNQNQIICLYGNLKVDDLKVSFPRLKFVHGDIICPYIRDVYGFCSLERITGSLICDSLIDASGFYKLKSIGLDIELPVLQFSVGLDSLVSIGRHAYFPSLIECKNFLSCQSIGQNAFYPNLAEVYFPSVAELPKTLKIHH